MSSPHAAMQMQRNVDRLVRSLVGVIDYAVRWGADGRISRLDILKDPAVEDHQLVRNVVSGLGAGAGVRVQRAAVRAYTDATAFGLAKSDAAASHHDGVPADAAAAAAGHGNGSHASHGNGNGRRNGNGANGHGGNGSGAHRNGVGGTATRGANGNVARGNGGSGNGAQARGHSAAGNGANGNGARGDGNGAAGNGAAKADGRKVGGSDGGSPGTTAGVGKAPAVEPEVTVKGVGRPVPERLIAQLLRADAPPSGQDGVELLRLDRVELEHRGLTLRCRVVLTLGEQIYSAIAEVPASPTAEADVAARVTLDALRAGALATARLDGVGFTSIGNSTYVVAAVRDDTGVPTAGTAVLQESMAHAASTALLAALGPITTNDLVAAEQRLGSMHH